MTDKVRTEKAVASRRDFLRGIVLTGAGMTGMGAFIQSCAEKGVQPSAGLAQLYIDGILNIIGTIVERELPKISHAATLAVQAKLQGHHLYSHITGNMFPQETNTGRPGSPDIFRTDNIQDARREDVMITNEPSIARGLSEQYVKVIGITTPFIPNSNTPPGALENMGVMRIEDVSDIIIQCHVPYTDGILDVEGLDIPICPASGVIHSLIYYALAAEIVEGFTKSGIYPRIG